MIRVPDNFGYSYFNDARVTRSFIHIVLARKWMNDLVTRPDMRIKVGRKLHDIRILDRIVGVRSTEQSAGIIVGGF